MRAFGGPFQIIDDTELPADARPHPVAYAAWVKSQLTSLRQGDQAISALPPTAPHGSFLTTGYNPHGL